MTTPQQTLRRTAVWVVILATGLMGSIVVSVTLGPADISAGDVWRVVLARLGINETELPPLREAIVWELRIPRVLTAAAVGAGLAVCGAIMQTVLHHPLADPYLLGLSSGASLGAVIVIVIGATLPLPGAAFAGAAIALGATLLLAGAGRRITPSRTILAGVTWSTAALAFVVTPVIGACLLLSARTLDAFAFGDHSATSLGVPVEQTRWILLGATALLTGCLAAVSGSIGFIGLVVPHAVRLLAGPGHRAVLPLSMLAGAITLTWADTAARTLADPRELPVGVVTALVGGPAFCLILLRARRLS